MKKFVFIILVIIILLSLIFFPWLISLLNFDNNIYSGILTYAGATLGGLLTLLGVCATIEYSKKEQAEQLELQYLPILKFDVISKDISGTYEDKELILLFNSPYFNDSDPNFGDMFLSLSNVGRGEIYDLNIKITNVELIHSTIPIDKNNIVSYILNDKPFYFIPVGSQVLFHLGCPTLIKDFEHENPFIFLISYSFDINFKGIFNKKDYNYKLDFCVSIKEKDNKYFYHIYNSHLYLN